MKACWPTETRPRVTRQQVPHLRDRDVAAQLDDVADASLACPPRHGRDGDQNANSEHHGDHARRGLAVDADRDRGAEMGDGVAHGVIPFPEGPAGGQRERSGTPDGRQGFRSPGLMRKPIDWLMPSTMAPMKAPQMEPMPPMMTASKA